MPPVVMTKVIAAATINSGADWRRMLSRFGADRNASVVTEKIRQTTAKNNAIETTLPLASIASRQLLSRTRGRAVGARIGASLMTAHLSDAYA